MAIVIRARVPGMTPETYERMSVQLLEQIRKQKGFVAHAGVAIPGGIEVTEFWESQEAFDAWIKGTVLPASTAAGLPVPILEVAPALRVQLK